VFEGASQGRWLSWAGKAMRMGREA
jgi:hypothetical protein